MAHQTGRTRSKIGFQIIQLLISAVMQTIMGSTSSTKHTCKELSMILGRIRLGLIHPLSFTASPPQARYYQRVHSSQINPLAYRRLNRRIGPRTDQGMPNAQDMSAMMSSWYIWRPWPSAHGLYAFVAALLALLQIYRGEFSYCMPSKRYSELRKQLWLLTRCKASYCIHRPDWVRVTSPLVLGD